MDDSFGLSGEMDTWFHHDAPWLQGEQEGGGAMVHPNFNVNDPALANALNILAGLAPSPAVQAPATPTVDVTCALSAAASPAAELVVVNSLVPPPPATSASPSASTGDLPSPQLPPATSETRARDDGGSEQTVRGQGQTAEQRQRDGNTQGRIEHSAEDQEYYRRQQEHSQPQYHGQQPSQGLANPQGSAHQPLYSYGPASLQPATHQGYQQPMLLPYPYALPPPHAFAPPYGYQTAPPYPFHPPPPPGQPYAPCPPALDGRHLHPHYQHPSLVGPSTGGVETSRKPSLAERRAEIDKEEAEVKRAEQEVEQRERRAREETERRAAEELARQRETEEKRRQAAIAKGWKAARATFYECLKREAVPDHFAIPFERPSHRQTSRGPDPAPPAAKTASSTGSERPSAANSTSSAKASLPPTASTSRRSSSNTTSNLSMPDAPPSPALSRTSSGSDTTSDGSKESPGPGPAPGRRVQLAPQSQPQNRFAFPGSSVSKSSKTAKSSVSGSSERLLNQHRRSGGSGGKTSVGQTSARTTRGNGYGGQTVEFSGEFYVVPFDLSGVSIEHIDALKSAAVELDWRGRMRIKPSDSAREVWDRVWDSLDVKRDQFPVGGVKWSFVANTQQKRNIVLDRLKSVDLGDESDSEISAAAPTGKDFKNSLTKTSILFIQIYSLDPFSLSTTAETFSARRFNFAKSWHVRTTAKRAGRKPGQATEAELYYPVHLLDPSRTAEKDDESDDAPRPKRARVRRPVFDDSSDEFEEVDEPAPRSRKVSSSESRVQQAPRINRASSTESELAKPVSAEDPSDAIDRCPICNRELLPPEHRSQVFSGMLTHAQTDAQAGNLLHTFCRLHEAYLSTAFDPEEYSYSYVVGPRWPHAEEIDWLEVEDLAQRRLTLVLGWMSNVTRLSSFLKDLVGYYAAHGRMDHFHALQSPVGLCARPGYLGGFGFDILAKAVMQQFDPSTLPTLLNGQIHLSAREKELFLLTGSSARPKIEVISFIQLVLIPKVALEIISDLEEQRTGTRPTYEQARQVMQTSADFGSATATESLPTLLRLYEIDALLPSWCEELPSDSEEE